MAEVCARAPARRRAQRPDRLRRGVRRRAAQPSRDREDLLHRLDRGRPDRDARRGRADPAGVARARRQGARDRLPDSDDDATVAHVITAMRFARQGQSCTAGSRLFVHASIFDDFTARLVEQLDELVVGDALDERSDIGSIVSGDPGRPRLRVRREALDQGATALAGGLPDDGRPGYQLPAHRAHRRRAVVARRARGGLRPVLVALPWDDEDEVIAWANDTHYGLAAFVFSQGHRPRAARRASDRGRLGAGQPQRRPAPGMSYGGKKLSGLGSEYSIEGALESFTQRKGITIGVGEVSADISVPWASPRRRNASGRSRPERAGHGGRSRTRAEAAVRRQVAADGRRRARALRGLQRMTGGGARRRGRRAPEPRRPRREAPAGTRGSRGPRGAHHARRGRRRCAPATRTRASRAPRSPTSPSTRR